jgi:hypothetical protein
MGIFFVPVLLREEGCSFGNVPVEQKSYGNGAWLRPLVH